MISYPNLLTGHSSYTIRLTKRRNNFKTLFLALKQLNCAKSLNITIFERPFKLYRSIKTMFVRKGEFFGI